MTKRSTCLILTVVLFSVALFSLSYAQQPIKIGVVNSQQVLQQSVEGKNAISRLEAKRKSNQDKLAKLDEEIRQLQTKLNTQRLTLTNEAILQLSSDLDKKQTERKRFAEDSVRELQDLQMRLFNRVQGELLPIIEQIGKEKNLDIIFD